MDTKGISLIRASLLLKIPYTEAKQILFTHGTNRTISRLMSNSAQLSPQGKLTPRFAVESKPIKKDKISKTDKRPKVRAKTKLSLCSDQSARIDVQSTLSCSHNPRTPVLPPHFQASRPRGCPCSGVMRPREAAYPPCCAYVAPPAPLVYYGMQPPYLYTMPAPYHPH